MHASKKKLGITLLLLSLLSILPWLGLSHFYTKGEPREALVPQAMLESGNWILPQRYGETFATKPPAMHWVSALLSLPQGEVSELTARLPVALSGIGIILLTFLFFAKRYSRRTALIASMILLTSFEMHRSSMEARVDMPLALFMIAALLALFRRFEGNREWANWIAIVGSISGAFLVKGPVGAVLPLAIYALFLLYRGKSFRNVVTEMFLLGPASLLLPLTWYVAAYQVGGDHFLETIYNENFGRFTSTEDMGHKAPVYANLGYYLMGLLPWSILLIAALPSLIRQEITKPKGHFLTYIGTIRQKFMSLPPVIQYTWFIFVVVTLFYTIPSGKRSVYLLPAYPFLALLLAQWFERLIEQRHFALRLTAAVVSTLATLTLLLIGGTYWGVIHPDTLAQAWGIKGETAHTLQLLTPHFQELSLLGALLSIALLGSLLYLGMMPRKESRKKLFYATFGVMFCLNLLLDGYILPVVKNGTSLRNFALECRETAKEETICMPSMEGLRFYVINYYLHNSLKPLNTTRPASGYCFVIEAEFQALQERYEGVYTFEEVRRTPHRYNDLRRVVLFVKFESTAQTIIE